MKKMREDAVVKKAEADSKKIKARENMLK